MSIQPASLWAYALARGYTPEQARMPTPKRQTGYTWGGYGA